MTQPKRSLEEIAYTTFPESEDRALRCLAALREAADAREAELLAAIPDNVREFYKQQGRREERELLLEVIAALQDLLAAHRLGSHSRGDKALTRLENARVKAGLDARSRAEEPQP